MVKCPFCKIEEEKFYNHIIEETNNFKVITGVGALVEGYILVFPKKHFTCMLDLNEDLIEEYQNILEKYRIIFKNIYGRYPIIFEHGTPNLRVKSSSSILHAHTHIINNNYLHEDTILEQLHFKILRKTKLDKKDNYIYYKSPDGKDYITYDFTPRSQLMRTLIADDLNVSSMYDWKEYPFEKNIYYTIEKLDEYMKTLDE